MTPSKNASKRLGRNPFTARAAALPAAKAAAPGAKAGARRKSFAKPTARTAAARAPRQLESGGWMLGLRYLVWGTFLAGLRFVLSPRSA